MFIGPQRNDVRAQYILFRGKLLCFQPIKTIFNTFNEDEVTEERIKIGIGKVKTRR